MGSQQQVYDEEDALSMQTGGAKAGDSGMQSRLVCSSMRIAGSL